MGVVVLNGWQISQPLRSGLRAFDQLCYDLHPFDAALRDVALEARAKKQGNRDLEVILDEVRELRKRILTTGRISVKGATTKETTRKLFEEAEEAVIDMLESGRGLLAELDEVHKALRKAPTVSLGSPIVALVGMPNVGKSSIVRSISSGTPTVSNYPFTTREMVLGHVQSHELVGQIMDTPGLLHRPVDEYNAMERLTVAAVQHLPTAIVFVSDLSGGAGAKSPWEDQVLVREHLLSMAQQRQALWLDVIAKSDLAPNDAAKDHHQFLVQEGALRISTVGEMNETFKEFEANPWERMRVAKEPDR